MQKYSVQKFVDRDRELEVLTRLISTDKPEFIVLYGRRRVGKTMLIHRLSSLVDACVVYIVGRRETKRSLLERLGRVCAEVFNDEYLAHGGFVSWDQFFRYIASRSQGRRVLLVFDEFPDMVYSSPELPSVLREYWDSVFTNSSIKIVVIGSSVSMMRRLFSSRESILYGRRSFELKLKPFDIVDASLFFSGKSFSDIIRYYGVVGGTPAYLEIASRLDLWELIDYSITKGTILYEDGYTLLATEVEEPRIHYMVLDKLSRGYRRLGSIASKAGVRINTLYKYIELLSILDIIGYRRNLLGRGRYYYIADPYYSWWISSVYNNIDLLERGLKKPVYEKLVKQLDQYVSLNTIPLITEQLVLRALDTNGLVDIGSILYKAIEFDLVLKYTNRYVIIESKWSDLDDREIDNIAREILGKAYMLKLGNPHVVILCKSINGDEKAHYTSRDYTATTYSTLYKHVIQGKKITTL